MVATGEALQHTAAAREARIAAAQALAEEAAEAPLLTPLIELKELSAHMAGVIQATLPLPYPRPCSLSPTFRFHCSGAALAQGLTLDQESTARQLAESQTFQSAKMGEIGSAEESLVRRTLPSRWAGNPAPKFARPWRRPRKSRAWRHAVATCGVSCRR